MSVRRPMVPWVYDIIASIFRICCSIFFREIYAPGAWRTPRQGPVIIVAAPHHNQFVDTALLIQILKQYAGRRVSFLIAEKSTREPIIGPLAGCAGALPVVRAMDVAKTGPGTSHLTSVDDPTLIQGRDVDFTDSTIFMVGGTIILPNVGSAPPEQQSIIEVLGPSSLRIKEPFKSFSAFAEASNDSSSVGTTYKIAPHVDRSRMFEAVYEELEAGGCIGIFPEGGSHDRPNLSPLKAGVAIIALDTLARSPDSGLTIIPCGMNYFSPNKFRSRAVIEFGPPIKVGIDQIEAFKSGGQPKRDAVGSSLETIQDALDSVSQQAPHRDVSTMVQATRRLYRPSGMKIPSTMVVEINRRLLKGYTRFKEEPTVQQLIKSVKAYEARSAASGIKDHQVEGGRYRRRPWSSILATSLYRVSELLVMSSGALPSVLLFWPVFLTARIISHRKQREALAKSAVKLDGKDVVGSWKIIVASILTPVSYTWYTVLATLWLSCSRGSHHIPIHPPPRLDLSRSVPGTMSSTAFSIAFFAAMVVVSFAGLRYGEIGVDILRSSPPLVMASSPSSSVESESLRSQRWALVGKVVQVINTFGPEIYPSFENEKLVSRHSIDDSGSEDDELYGGYATYTAGLKSISEHDRGKTNDADESIIHETIIASDKKTTGQGKDTLRMRGRERRF